MTTIFNFFWPFTSKLKFFFCCLMVVPLLLAFGTIYQKLGGGTMLVEQALDADGLTLLEDATVPHPSNHHLSFARMNLTVEMVENCPPFHGWMFKSQDGRLMKICDMGSDITGKRLWAVNIKEGDGVTNVTSIPKYGMRIAKLVRYVWNSGFSPAEGWGAFYLKVVAEFGL